MIRLNLSRELAWTELAAGVSVQVRPIEAAFVAAARAMAVTKVPPPIGKNELLIARRSQAFLVALGQLAIVAWDGVGDANDQPIAVTDAGIEALFELPPIVNAFSSRYFAPAVILDEEKNASTAGLTGIGVAVTATAPIAEPPASPAPTADAA
jgi:hypothetical protein